MRQLVGGIETPVTIILHNLCSQPSKTRGSAIVEVLQQYVMTSSF